MKLINCTGEPIIFPDGTTLMPEDYVPQVRHVVDGVIHGAPVVVPALVEPPPMFDADAVVIVGDEAVMAMREWLGDVVIPRSWLRLSPQDGGA